MLLPVVRRLGRILSLRLNLIIGLSRLLGWTLLEEKGVLGLSLLGKTVKAVGFRL